jgi:hypothetical protein
MDLSRLRGGELIAAVAGVVLLISLWFLNWYGGFSASIEGPAGITLSAEAEYGAWDQQGPLGTLANLIILAAGLAAVGLALLTASARTVALPVAASALTAGLGLLAVAMVIARMLFQPGANAAVDLEFGIWLALIGALGVAYGGWQSMQEEGTTFGEARERLRGDGASARGGRRPARPAAGVRADADEEAAEETPTDPGARADD